MMRLIKLLRWSHHSLERSVVSGEQIQRGPKRVGYYKPQTEVRDEKETVVDVTRIKYQFKLQYQWSLFIA